MDDDEEDLVDSIRALELVQFAEVSASRFGSAILSFCMLLPQRWHRYGYIEASDHFLFSYST